MPDTYLSAQRVDRGHFLDQWCLDMRPTLVAIRESEMAKLAALDSLWRQTYGIGALKAIADYACEESGNTIDLLSELMGHIKGAGEDVGVEPEFFAFDRTDLEGEHAKWKARSEERMLIAMCNKIPVTP